jgi:putative sugar O-methyltransferase
MFLYDFLLFILDIPLRIWNLILRKSGLKQIFSTDVSASDSESTDYSSFVKTVTTNEKKFKSFRSNFYYRQILEHVDFQLGLKYFNLLTEKSKSMLINYSEIVALSSIGSPRRYFFPKSGLISPTVIRYQYVSQELNRLFGDSLGTNIAEIGVGFGGQFVVLAKNFEFNSYAIFDLPQVINLTHKVVTFTGAPEKKILDCDINQPKLEQCDLVISNYAFSELPKGIQAGYIEGVLKNSRRGYLTMNSGRTDFSGRSSGKYSLEELKKLLPEFEVLPETPLTGPDNYIIVWGHRS